MTNIDTKGKTVLVTGGSGFIGARCILQLLSAGYRVRTTIRSLTREGDVRAMLKVGGAEPGEALVFFAADLMSDVGWKEAAAGCDYVLHVASPFPPNIPNHEDELIIPAREGALRVLRAARDAGVKRVVMTSSFAAIGYGHEPSEQPYSEESWTNPDDKNITAYVKSKTLAERAAWDFMAHEGEALELSVVNPVGVFGPVLGADYSSSIQLIQRLMDGGLPGSPRMSVSIVDVRDVADLHLRAMTHPAAKGERFLAVSGNSMTMQEIAKVLKKQLGNDARPVPTGVLPDWMIKSVALFDRSVAQIVPDLGKAKNATNDKARRLLGWNPRSNEEAVVATAESLVRLGLLRISKKAA
jgi:dihydroflavonol-4-reductase